MGGQGPSLRAAVLLCALAWALSGLPALPETALVRASEARAWGTARELAAGGDWLVPTYRGEPRLKKPPLHAWVQAAAMKAADDDGLPVAGFATWAVGFLWALGPLAIGAAAGRVRAGLLGALLLCGARAAGAWGTSPEHDLPFAGWVAVSLAALARALRADGRPWHAWAAGLLCGAAVLVKGPFALAFVGGTLVASTVFAPGPASGVRRTTLWLALLVGATAPVGLWLLGVAARTGSVAAVFDEVSRQASGGEGAHTRPLAEALPFYLARLARWGLPGVALGAVAGAWALWRRRRAAAGPPRFAVAASLVVFAVLTAAPGKQDHYLLALLPPVFVLVGAAVEALEAASPRAARGTAAALLLAGLGVAAWRWAGTPGDLVPAGAWVALGGLAAGGAVVAARAAPTRVVAACAVVAAAAAGSAAIADARREAWHGDYRHAAPVIAGLVPPDAVLVGFAQGSREAFDTVVAWLPHRYERARSVDELGARVEEASREGRGVAVLVAWTELGVVEEAILGHPAVPLLDLVADVEPRAADRPGDRVLLFRPGRPR